jgi:hypothetical protein
VGNDVVATGSGSIDLTGLTFFIRTHHPGPGSRNTGARCADVYGAGKRHVIRRLRIAHWSNEFRERGYTGANGGSGDLVGIVFTGPPISQHQLVVPAGYVSGPLSDTSTWNNQTFDSLGVTPGTYEWTWGSGTSNDSFTLDIVAPASVPEPASVLLLAGALVGLVVCRRRACA